MLEMYSSLQVVICTVPGNLQNKQQTYIGRDVAELRTLPRA